MKKDLSFLVFLLAILTKTASAGDECRVDCAADEKPFEKIVFDDSPILEFPKGYKEIGCMREGKLSGVLKYCSFDSAAVGFDPQQERKHYRYSSGEGVSIQAVAQYMESLGLHVLRNHSANGYEREYGKSRVYFVVLDVSSPKAIVQTPHEKIVEMTLKEGKVMEILFPSEGIARCRAVTPEGDIAFEIKKDTVVIPEKNDGLYWVEPAMAVSDDALLDRYLGPAKRAASSTADDILVYGAKNPRAYDTAIKAALTNPAEIDFSIEPASLEPGICGEPRLQEKVYQALRDTCIDQLKIELSKAKETYLEIYKSDWLAGIKNIYGIGQNHRVKRAITAAEKIAGSSQTTLMQCRAAAESLLSGVSDEKYRQRYTADRNRPSTLLDSVRAPVVPSYEGPLKLK